MLQQRLFSRSLPRASRRQFSAPAPPVARSRFAPARWYSQHPAAKEEATKEEVEAKETKTSTPQAEEGENPLKAELETKKEQNKDLTV